MSSTQNVLVLPDIHYKKKLGGEDRKTLDAVMTYASDRTWDKVVFLGDVMDLNVISSHNINNLRAVAGETVQQDYEYANKRLDEWEQATPGATKIYIEGNHEYRAERLIDAQPALKGLLEVPIGLELKRRGWLWVPYWSKGTTYSVGKATFGHGRYHNEHHAKTHAMRYGRNFYYGHIHDVQEFPVEREGDDATFEASSMGCLCAYQQKYLHGRPTKWQQAFGEFHFSKDGFFNKYTVRIFKHRFIAPNGRTYKG